MPACPKCDLETSVIKAGYYRRSSDSRLIQRYRCRYCKKGFSEQTGRLDYRYRRRDLDQQIFRGLCTGVSERGLAFLLGTKPETIARRIGRFGRLCAANLTQLRSRLSCDEVMFDEMESFEHTKCKPLTMPLVVEKKTRRILCVAVEQIAAKGHLAEISRKKYGPRPCKRHLALAKVFKELKECLAPGAILHSDESPHYPLRVARYFPPQNSKKVEHVRSLGRRGCVVGQGELKAGGFDPLFSLNHTCAMYRDRLKRLSRRTWCTTKRPDILLHLMNIYAWFHNLRLKGDRGSLPTLA